MSEHTLKPCPFCGEQPAINHIEAHSHSFQINGFKMPDHPGSSVIECTCGAGLIDSDFDTVAARWNARAMPLPEVNGNKEREVFEKWVSDQGVAMDYRGDGIYGNPTVRRWREGFLAALELVRFPRDTDALQKEINRLSNVKFAFDEWIEKTNWIQHAANASELGKHRADVLRERIEAAQKENEQLREALIDLISIVKIHQDATKNRFAWAEIDCAEEALKGGAA